MGSSLRKYALAETMKHIHYEVEPSCLYHHCRTNQYLAMAEAPWATASAASCRQSPSAQHGKGTMSPPFLVTHRWQMMEGF